MKLYEKYLQLKSNNKDKLYLFKSGVFYIFLEEDAEKASYILDLKLSKFGKDIIKCGFPSQSLYKFKNILDKNDIKYEIVDNSISKVQSNKDVVCEKVDLGKELDTSSNNSNKENKYEEKYKGVEDLIIYKQYVELIDYSLFILLKFPKMERYSLCEDIRKAIYDGLFDILYAYRVYDKSIKLNHLIDLDVKLKYIKTLIRVAYKKKYIRYKNLNVWFKKIYHIGNLLGGWISLCQKV